MNLIKVGKLCLVAATALCFGQVYSAASGKNVVVFLNPQAEVVRQAISEYIEGIIHKQPVIRIGDINLSGLLGNEILIAVQFFPGSRFEAATFLPWLEPIKEQLVAGTACILFVRYGKSAGMASLDERLNKFTTYQVAGELTKIFSGLMEDKQFDIWLKNQLSRGSQMRPMQQPIAAPQMYPAAPALARQQQLLAKQPQPLARQQAQIREDEIVEGIGQLSALLQRYSRNDDLGRIVYELRGQLDDALARIVNLH